MRRQILVRTALTAALALSVAGCTKAGVTDPAAGSATRSAATGDAAAAADQSEPLQVSKGAAAKLVPSAIRASHTLRIASDASYPPFEFFASDNKTIVGFDVDLSKAIAQKLGLRAENINAGFDTILTGISSGRYEIGISDFDITPERAKSVDFVTYLVGGSGIAVATGNPLKMRMDASTFCGRTVAAQKGSVQGLTMLPSFSAACTKQHKKPVTIQLYPSQNEANLAVSSGRADAVLANTVPLKYSADHSNGTITLAPGPDYQPAQTGVAIRKDSGLTPAVAAALKEIVADGTFDKIMKKWGIPGQEKSAEIGKITR